MGARAERLGAVALNSLLLLAVAMVYNNATGRRYPHTQWLEAMHPRQTGDIAPIARTGF